MACIFLKTIEYRRSWLRYHQLPLDTFMDDQVRWWFLKYAKHRLEQQEDSAEETHTYKRMRWMRDLQRRCGCKVLWELVSFTGTLQPDWLVTIALKSESLSDSQENTGGLTRALLEKYVPNT